MDSQPELYEDDIQPSREIMLINGVISCAVNVFVMVLIMRKTPLQMKDYRRYLLNIAVSFVREV